MCGGERRTGEKGGVKGGEKWGGGGGGGGGFEYIILPNTLTHTPTHSGVL